jgi:hypothetical protein
VVIMGFTGITTAVDATVSGAVGVTKQYGMGAVTLNGSALSQVTQFTVDCGCSPIMDTSDGNIFPNDIQLENRRPTIGFSTTNLTLPAGNGGLVLSSPGVVVKLRRYSNATGGYAAGSVNITAAIAAGAIYPETISGRPAESSFVTDGIESSGTNLVITSGVA